MADYYLSSLINAGADAHSNLYLVKFTANGASPVESGSAEAISNSLSVRCSGIEIPAAEQDSYPVKFVTATIDRPVAKVKLDRQLSFTFRVDANFAAYKTLLSIQKKYFNPVTHEINAHISSGDLFKVDVYYLRDVANSSSFGGNSSGVTADMEDSNNLMYTFSDCWITNIQGLDFSTDDSKALTVSVTVRFMDMKAGAVLK